MAASLNRVTIVGRIGQDPKLSYTPSGAAVANLSVATDESYVKDSKKVEKTEWHRIVLWNKQAEFCANYLGKGRLVLIEGKLQTRSWESNGETKYTTEIIAHSIQALDRKPEGEQGLRQQQDDRPRTAPNEASGMGDDVPF